MNIDVAAARGKRRTLTPEQKASAGRHILPTLAGCGMFQDRHFGASRLGRRPVRVEIVGPQLEGRDIHGGWCLSPADPDEPAVICIVCAIGPDETFEAWRELVMERAASDPVQPHRDDADVGTPISAFAGDLMLQTLVHEWADAILGSQSGHDDMWRDLAAVMMREAGLDRRTLEARVIAAHFGLTLEAALAMSAHRVPEGVQ